MGQAHPKSGVSADRRLHVADSLQDVIVRLERIEQFLHQGVDRTKEYFTLDEVAYLFSVSKREIQNEINRRRLRVIKFGRMTRVHRDELDAYSRLLRR